MRPHRSAGRRTGEALAEAVEALRAARWGRAIGTIDITDTAPDGRERTRVSTRATLGRDEERLEVTIAITRMRRGRPGTLQRTADTPKNTADSKISR